LESAFDRFGNAMAIEYLAEDDAGVDALSHDATRFASATSNRYAKRILYGNAAPLDETSGTSGVSWHFEAVFDFGDHDASAPSTAPSQT
jgi:insecticidal toxin complex protein TccC